MLISKAVVIVDGRDFFFLNQLKILDITDVSTVHYGEALKF